MIKPDLCPDVPYKDNKTIRYLLPTLGMRLDKLSIILDNVHLKAIDILRYLGLKGVYHSWKDCPDKWENEVYMVFVPKDKILYTNFYSFYEYLKTLNNFVGMYHVTNNFIVLVMKIDSKYQFAKDVVASGLYSKLGKTYANIFFNNNGKLTKEFHIICQTDEYRRKIELELGLPEGHLIGCELDEFFNPENEVLDLEKLNIKFKDI